jgi:hypothetical protein
VLEATGLDKVRIWMKYRIVEPRFDDPRAQMPNLGLTEGEARALTAYLMGEAADSGRLGPVERAKSALAAALPAPAGPRELVLFFGAGLILGAVGLAAIVWLWRAWSG